MWGAGKSLFLTCNRASPSLHLHMGFLLCLQAEKWTFSLLFLQSQQFWGRRLELTKMLDNRVWRVNQRKLTSHSLAQLPKARSDLRRVWKMAVTGLVAACFPLPVICSECGLCFLLSSFSLLLLFYLIFHFYFFLLLSSVNETFAFIRCLHSGDLFRLNRTSSWDHRTLHTGHRCLITILYFGTLKASLTLMTS